MRGSRGFGSVVTAVFGIFLAAVLVAVVLPASDAATRRPSARACMQHPGECADAAEPGLSPSEAADRNEKTSWARGRDVYISEGCATCHTQQVRPVLADVGLGPVSIPGDYAFEDPPLLGLRRMGPDLSNVGTRRPYNECGAVVDYLKNPQSVHDWSNSPSYEHLGDADLTDLATYITRLRPAGAEGPVSCDPGETATPEGTPAS